MEKKQEKFLLSDISFPLLVGLLGAAVFAGAHMYVVHRVGAFNEIYTIKMLDQGLNTGDYAAAAGFAAGFLVARVLEGPLVGLMDIGGAIMTGVGIGIPAILLAAGIEAPVKSFPLALLCGGIIGLIIGSIVIGIRKVMPKGMAASGTGIMMGAGNSTGRFLGPLIILSAIQYSVPAGIGSFLGAALFYKYDRHIAGGAIIGAMVLGWIVSLF